MTFDLYATPTHPADHNQPPDLTIMAEIDDLYAEAKNWADGEPVTSAKIAMQVTTLYDSLHAAGAKCDALRVAEKKPLDDQIDAIQIRYNPYVQAKKGKVALGKEALGALLSAWRKKVADAAAKEAEAKRLEAARLAEEAQAAIRASAGNLEAREKAEELLIDAKAADKWAARAEKKATTGTGLRTVWVTTIADEGAALDWAYSKAPFEFISLALQMAKEEVRVGKRNIPGFAIKEDKVAT